MRSVTAMSPESPEAGAPQTVLFALIKDRLQRTPFVSFRIVTSRGQAYDVPTADHAVVFPKFRVVYTADDAEGGVEIHTLHVSSLESLRPKARKRAA